MAQAARTIVASIEIAAAPTIVFDFVQDPLRRAAWDERVVRAWLPAGGGPGKGARLCVESRVLGPLEVVNELEYTHYERPLRSAVKLVAVRGPSLVVRGGGAWIYEAVADGTRFSTRFSYEVGWGALGRLHDRLWFHDWLRRLTEQSLANLKREVEALAPAQRTAQR